MRGCWGQVLIETLWNVNMHPNRRLGFRRASFNRNIVECKFGKTHVREGVVVSFNRNIVECK